jgi:hypothetical protein
MVRMNTSLPNNHMRGRKKSITREKNLTNSTKKKIRNTLRKTSILEKEHTSFSFLSSVILWQNLRERWLVQLPTCQSLYLLSNSLTDGTSRKQIIYAVTAPCILDACCNFRYASKHGNGMRLQSSRCMSSNTNSYRGTSRSPRHAVAAPGLHVPPVKPSNSQAKSK